MQQQKIVFEISWILVAIAFTMLVLAPIWIHADSFSFWTANATFIFTFITAARVLFTLKYTFWSRSQVLKFILVFATLPLLFYLISRLNHFLAFLDDYTLSRFFDHLSSDQELQMTKYVRTEMIFFAVGSIIASFALPFRLIISIWRQRNRGTV